MRAGLGRGGQCRNTRQERGPLAHQSRSIFYLLAALREDWKSVVPMQGRHQSDSEKYVTEVASCASPLPTVLTAFAASRTEVSRLA
jgi:hypothetical protein